MKKYTVKIGEREIPLKFGMREFAEMEEEIGNLSEISELLLEGKSRVRNTISAIRVMGNAGLMAAGEKPDITNDWLMDNMMPNKLKDYQRAVLDCMSDGQASQAIKEENENKERDLVLEEIEQKKDPVNSHTGG